MNAGHALERENSLSGHLLPRVEALMLDPQPAGQFHQSNVAGRAFDYVDHAPLVGNGYVAVNAYEGAFW